MQNVKIEPLRRDASDEKIKNRRQTLCNCLDAIVFPFFSRISTPEALLDFSKGKHCDVLYYFSCPELQIYRLQLFTQLYLGNFSEIEEVITQYHCILQNAYSFTARVRQNYLHEMEIVRHIALAEQSSSNYFCSQIIDETTKNVSPAKQQKRLVFFAFTAVLFCSSFFTKNYILLLRYIFQCATIRYYYTERSVPHACHIGSLPPIQLRLCRAASGPGYAAGRPPGS